MMFIGFICRLAVGSIFLMAGATKLAGRRRMVDDIRSYRLLPDVLARIYGSALPWMEVLAASSLLSGILVEAGCLLAMLLLISFVSAVGIAVRRRLNLSCGCLGLLYRERVGWGTLSRDGILLAVDAVALLFGRNAFSLPEVVAHLDSPANASALAGMVIVVVASLLPIVGVARRGGERSRPAQA